MRTLSIAVLFVLSSLAGLSYAQRAQGRDTDITQPTPITLEQLLQEQKTTCYLPDDSTHPLNTTTTYDGQRYRCVEVFAGALVRAGQRGTLTVHSAGWIKVP